MSSPEDLGTYWPPTLAQLKVDGKINNSDRDAAYSQELAAAVEYVQEKRTDVDFSGLLTDLELAAAGMRRVTATLRLGTIRLALRWHARGRTPDGMVASTDQGSVRVTSWDADIDRMLRIGRYARPVTA